MKYRVMMQLKTPGRSGLDRVVHHDIPFYSAQYDTLEEAVEVINMGRLTVADKAISSWKIQRQHVEGGRSDGWQEMEYGDWAHLVR